MFTLFSPKKIFQIFTRFFFSFQKREEKNFYQGQVHLSWTNPILRCMLVVLIADWVEAIA